MCVCVQCTVKINCCDLWSGPNRGRAGTFFFFFFSGNSVQRWGLGAATLGVCRDCWLHSSPVPTYLIHLMKDI